MELLSVRRLHIVHDTMILIHTTMRAVMTRTEPTYGRQDAATERHECDVSLLCASAPT